MTAALRSQGPWQAVVLLIAAAFGLLAGLDPVIAAGAAVGAAFMLVVTVNLHAGLCLFVFAAFLDHLPGIDGGNLTIVKALGALLFLSWLAAVTTHRYPGKTLFADHPTVTVLATFFVAWMVLSLGWVEDRGPALTDISRWLLNLALLPVLYTAVRDRTDLIRVIALFIAAAGVSAVYALAGPTTSDEYSRIEGVAGTANELASILVIGIVLASFMWLAAKNKPLARLACALVLGLCLVALFLTVSRSGLVALAAALLAAVFLSGRWRLGAGLLLVAVMATTLGWFSFAAPEAARERVTTYGDGGTGRTDIWTVALRMVNDHPVQGVGIGNFRTTSVHYLVQPGLIRRSEFILDRPLVAHNSYLNVLAELGFVGLLTFLALLGYCLSRAWMAARGFTRGPDRVLELCARGLVVALVGLLAADFFASDQLNKSLWLLLGMCLVLPKILRQQQAELASEPVLTRSHPVHV